jgi:hypothetical protein
MKWRSLEYDKDVKPLWREWIGNSKMIGMATLITSIIRKDYEEANASATKWADGVMVVAGIAILFVIISGWVYLIKPSLFKNKVEMM